jgi:Zn-dependent M28 family amino/carboxypeptidase
MTLLRALLLTAPLLGAPALAKAQPAFTPAEQQVAARITARDIAPHVAFLSDDLLEGRAPGSRGEQLSARYIAAAMQSYGLQPAGEGGTFFQKVPLVSILPRLPATATFRQASGARSVVLKLPDELVVMSGTQGPSGRISGAQLVFVGYGIVAPEYDWDDYKDVDVRGKVVVVMNNDPEKDPALFAGKTRLWYGRWDYKYLQAAKKGAVGAIIIHTTPSAGYPFQVVKTSNTAARFELPAGDEPRLVAKMWATEEASRRLVALGGQELESLRAAAETRQSRPVPLGVSLSLAFTNTIRRTEGENVIGRLPGGDAKLREQAVIYTAHHDHLGIRAPQSGNKDGNKDGDQIYNGALDNASGVALMLAMAHAAAEGPPPRRSLIFAALTAEEQGLLGSEWYCRHPTLAPGRIAANINLDSINHRGRTSDFSFIGLGKSSLDPVIEAVARAQGRTLQGDAFPDRGFFYRSDQFNFARIGVPAIYGRGGPSFIGRPAGWGREQQELYERQHYHQPSDEYDAKSWNFEGAIEDGRLLLITGLRVAGADQLPRWKPGDEFEAARKKALDALR